MQVVLPADNVYDFMFVNLSAALAATTVNGFVRALMIPFILGIRCSAIPLAQETTNGNSHSTTCVPPSTSCSTVALFPSKSKVMEKKAVEVTELELLISAGLNRFPGFTAGKFNVTSVSDQFKSEINKAVVAQIDAQIASAKKKIEDAKGVASEKTGLSNEQIEGIIGVIFSKTRTAVGSN